MNNSFKAQIPFENNALEPFLSTEAIKYHYGKHHQGYANTLNSLIINTDFAKMSLIDIIKFSRNKHEKIFNNASQIYNHDFYWNCLTNTKTHPNGKLAQMIKQQFESTEKFFDTYINFAGTMFGSGWSWLLEQNEELIFLNTSNAENPIGSSQKPICVIDLWEHAYYIDYRNDRAKYINTLIRNHINWDFCEKMLNNKPLKI